MTATQRIELSRARLRQAMEPAPALRANSKSATEQAWLQQLKHIPAIGIVIDTVSAWWSRHPLRAMVSVVADASSAVAAPLARSHPLTLVAVAALVGAVLASSRPWRWALKPALFAGLMPQLISRVVSSMPLESWLSALASSLSAGNPPPEPHRTSS